MDVKGRVSATSGEPLRKARVSLSSTNFEKPVAYVTRTDSEGAYRLADVEPGQYHLEAHRPGYVREGYGGRMAGWGATVPITVAPDRALGVLDLVLKPQATIAGRVLDPDGDPLEGVRVTLLQEMTWNGQTQVVPFGGQV